MASKVCCFPIAYMMVWTGICGRIRFGTLCLQEKTSHASPYVFLLFLHVRLRRDTVLLPISIYFQKFAFVEMPLSPRARVLCSRRRQVSLSEHMLPDLPSHREGASGHEDTNVFCLGYFRASKSVSSAVFPYTLPGTTQLLKTHTACAHGFFANHCSCQLLPVRLCGE